MNTGDPEILRCVDCSADLSLKAGRNRIEGGEILDGILECQGCFRTYPVLNGVGILFRKQEAGHFLNDWERARIDELGFSEVLDGLDTPSGEKISDMVKVAENWEYQHNEVLHWEEVAGEGQFHGKEKFWTFIPIDPKQVSGAIVFVGCVGRGKEVSHVLAEIGAEVHGIPEIFHSQRRLTHLPRCDFRLA